MKFKWYQQGDGGAFYIKLYEDDDGMPGAETYSAVQASGNADGWNDKDLTAAGLNVSGDFWIGTKEFSASKPFGLDTSSDAGHSYQRAGSSGDWTSISGNLAYHILLDCGDNCESESECDSAQGDLNQDGIINVLDVVAIVNFVLEVLLPNDCQYILADIILDGIINVLDVVWLVNCVLGITCE